MSLGLIFLVTGCAGLKTRVSKNPLAGELSGNRVFVSVRAESGSIESTIAGQQIKTTAIEWLMKRGFEVVTVPRKANTTITFWGAQKAKTVHVPAQTYSMPIYNPGQTYTANAYDNRGNWATATAQESGTWSSQTHYRGAYDARVVDELLEVYVDKYIRGKKPVTLSQGQLFKETYDQNIFGDEKTLKQAVTKLLSESSLGEISRATASISSEDPGCWPRLGVNFNNSRIEAEKVYEIESFDDLSQAEAAGIRKGDIISNINGHEISSEEALMDEWNEGQAIPVRVKRAGKEVKVKVPTVMLCI